MDWENKGYRAKEKNMNKATLVVMAAGIGSRFGGGIKQLEPVGPNGEIIMDYSIYDAMEAGFDKVVFVIRKDLDLSRKCTILPCQKCRNGTFSTTGQTHQRDKFSGWYGQRNIP